MILPEIPVGDWVASFFDWLDETLEWFWDFLTTVFEALFGQLADLLLFPPPLVLALIFGGIAWAARGWKVGLGTALGFALAISLQVWEPTMQTLSLVIIAAGLCVIVGIPIGILAARNNVASTIIRPILDFMQTIHPFVYLPIAIAFFGIGTAAGVAATIIFATPPAVRLTELGIRQVDREMVEAGEAFGATPRQILGRIQMPLSLPTVMAGVNQVIMLSLSMVVLAGFVGTPGLGQEIIFALSRVEVAAAVDAGIGLAVIAIFLDRTSRAVGSGTGRRRSAGVIAKFRAVSVSSGAGGEGSAGATG